MTWVVLVTIILTSLIKILMTCLPLGAVEWIQNKFALHSKLDEEKVSVVIDGKLAEADVKKEIISRFNKATFMQKQHIYPGNERNFLERVDSEHVIIENLDTKKATTLHIFHYPDRTDVVKQYKKKLIAYSLFNEQLQDFK